MSEPAVLIAGAGPTGLVLALWLSRVGVPFRLIDRKPEAGGGSRAMALQARTLELYRQLGISEQVIAGGFRMTELHLRNRTRQVAVFRLGDIGKDLSPYPFALSFPQDDHERLLNECLRVAGHAVEWNTELVSFTQQEDGVRAVLRKPSGEETWNGLYLCGCDGSHSAVRHGLGIGFPGGTYDQPFYVADAVAEGAWSDRDINGHIAENGLCLSFPVRTPGMFRLIGIVPEALRGRENLTFEDLQPEVEQLTGNKVQKVNWFSVYRIHHRVADSFRRGRVFLAGDAGHVHSPAGGQGMNTGIGDAVNLAWKLAAVLKKQAAPHLLDSYEAERLPFARSLVATTDRFFQGVIGKGLRGRLVRTILIPLLLPLALRFKFIRRAQFRVVSQIRIHYRPSPLSDGMAGPTQAGDRLPWVVGTDNFQILTSLAWQIHVYGTASESVRELAKRTGLALHVWPWTRQTRLAGLTQDALYLVRPDGYVGFARTTQDTTALQAYLERFAITTG